MVIPLAVFILLRILVSPRSLVGQSRANRIPSLSLSPSILDSVGWSLLDFSSLGIGGVSGTMIWTTTPTPVVDAEWVQWTGLYTPSAADVGQPFIFEAIFDLDGRHAVAIDGPITISAGPGPPPAGFVKPVDGLRDYNGTYEGDDQTGSIGYTTLYRDNADFGVIAGMEGEGYWWPSGDRCRRSELRRRESRSEPLWVVRSYRLSIRRQLLTSLLSG